MKRYFELGLLLLLMDTTPALALKSDRDQPIEITADSAERDEKLGITLYHGNVKIHQGTVLMEAETVTLKTHISPVTSKEELEDIVIVGSPSHLQQRRENGEVMDATSTSMRYEVSSDSIQLMGDAVLKQGERMVTGDNITYDISAQKVIAQTNPVAAGTDNPGEQKSGRVTVTIPPKSAVPPSDQP